MYLNINNTVSNPTKIVLDEELGLFKSTYIRGCNNNVGISASTNPVDIYAAGGVYPFLSTAEKLLVSSDDANDTIAGTGVRQVRIEGLDSNLDEIDEVVDLDGVTPVQTVKDYLRVNNYYGISCGTAESNVGTIDLTWSSVPANILARILPDAGISLSAVYSLARNTRKVIVASTVMSMQRKIGAYIVGELRIRSILTGTPTPWQDRIIYGPTGGYQDIKGFDRHVFYNAAGVDLKFRVTDASDNNTHVFAAMEFKRFIKV